MKALAPFEKLNLIRKKNRPVFRDYLPLIFDGFIELHGDRQFGDDRAICGGIGYFEGIPVTVIGQSKGKDLDQNKKMNFGMPHPEGYRKALRLMHQAEKFKRPVICLIDTPGAFCGIAAEERGQGEAIAKNLFELSKLKTPVISVVLSEGGSGGALALALCDSLAMLSNSIYSIISPRGFASILWKDPSREMEAANVMKITAEHLKKFGVADCIINEPAGGANKDIEAVAEGIKQFLRKEINKLSGLSIEEMLEKRYEKYRKIGMFKE